MKTIITIIVVAIIGVIGYNYATRPASAPSQDVQNVVETATTTDSTATSTIYKISSTDSKVEFKIGEVLHGSPYTPIGTTTQVAGEIIISTSTAKFSKIAINARTWVTDDPRRNGAIARFILKSEDAANEFIYFVPTNDLSFTSPLKPGQLITGNLSGNLTISGVTKPAIFAVKMQVTGDTATGTAVVALKRSDFNLVIPNVPFVASVDDNFTVTANIIANKVQ